MDRQRRIGIDARLWNETGVGRYIRNLVAELTKIDKTNEYVLFLRKREFHSLSFQNKNIIKVLADIPWHGVAEQISFPSLITKQKVDLMHFPYFSVPILYRKPFVITIHDLIIDHFPTGQASTHWMIIYKFKLIVYKLILRIASKRAKKIIAVSEATKQEILDHLPVDASKIIVTHEGIDNAFTTTAKEDNTLKNLTQKPYFLYVGNAYPHKNLPVLIKAFRDFHKTHLSARLILVGKEDYFYKKLKRTVAGMQLDSVLFAGYVSDTHLAYLYSHALATVVPSLMEGFGLPALEAMAHKSLVVASRIPSLEEVCGDSALYFDQTSTVDLQNKLQEVYTTKKTDFLVRKEVAQKRVKVFSWEKLALLTKEVYESCISLR